MPSSEAFTKSWGNLSEADHFQLLRNYCWRMKHSTDNVILQLEEESLRACPRVWCLTFQLCRMSVNCRCVLQHKNYTSKPRSPESLDSWANDEDWGDLTEPSGWQCLWSSQPLFRDAKKLLGPRPSGAAEWLHSNVSAQPSQSILELPGDLQFLTWWVVYLTHCSASVDQGSGPAPSSSLKIILKII